MDRFDLEQAFMHCWGTKEDIALVCEALLDGKASVDEMANAMIGLCQIHDMRCKKAFDIFESLIADGQITSGPEYYEEEDTLFMNKKKKKKHERNI